MKIKNVEIVNYRNFDKCEMELADFNVLIGKNGTGKSNFLNAIMLPLRGHDLSGDPFLPIKDARDISKETKINLSATLSEIEVSSLPKAYSNSSTSGVTNLSYLFTGKENSISTIQVDRMPKNGHSPNINVTIIRNTQITIRSSVEGDILNATNVYGLRDSREIPNTFVPREIKNPSNFDSSNALLYMKLNYREKYDNLIRNVKSLIPEIEDLPIAIEQNLAGISFIETDVNKVIGSPNISKGFREILILLITLEFSPEQSLILIEEPEAHLHGSAITSIKNLILEYIGNKGIQVIIATHSPLFLEGLYPSQNKQIKFFEFKKQNGITEVNDLIDEEAISNIPLSMGYNNESKT
ncbi:MAG: AAA family ATPase [Thermoplasmatales archaeon]